MPITLTRNKWFLLSLALPIFVLLSMTTKPLLTTLYGEEIKLQTVPYDPRDLFYGDYVDLQFDVEAVPLEKVEKELHQYLDIEGNSYKPYHDKNVYIVLEKDGAGDGMYKARKVVRGQPKSGTYIRGVMSPWVDVQEKKRIVSIQIPIERYYLEENTGKQLEKASSRGKLVATIKLYKGYGILQGVEVGR